MKILDTLALSEPMLDWEGKFNRGAGELPDGTPGAEVAGRVSTTALLDDWSGYGSLQYTVWNPGDRAGIGGLFILDDEAVDSPEREYGDFVDRGTSMLYPDGLTHVVVDIDPIKTTQGTRDLDLEHVNEVALSFPWHGGARFVVSKLRLSGSVGQPDGVVPVKPGDSVMHLHHLDIRCYTHEPERYVDAPDVVELKLELQDEVKRLEAAIEVAKLGGKQTLYEEMPLVIADIALKVRPMFAWHFSPARKRANLGEALDMVRPTRRTLESYVRGVKHEDDEDDSNIYIPHIREVPDLGQLKIDGKYFVDDLGQPQLVCSMNYHHYGRLMPFFAPDNHRVELYSIGGGSRYDIESSPVYEAFHMSDDAKRVGWRGWCGHLIKDQWAMGGRKENVVICLEHKPMLDAIAEYNRMHANEWRGLSQLMYVILAYELMYICYCDESKRMFRKWLKTRHGTVAKLNKAWGTKLKSFDQAEPPPCPGRGPDPDCNRAAWFDWADWNTTRFTDHMKWSKAEIRKLHETIPICSGGTHSMFSAGNGTTGIDEELIINEVDDVILHEGGDLIGIDLYHALSDKPKPIVDPEHGGTCANWMLNYFHGKATLAKFWWPKQPSRQFPRSTMGAPMHGLLPLAEAAEEIRIALDVRRLNIEICAFWEIPKEVAIHYSKTNILQVPPAVMTGRTTPYIDAVRATYDTARFLDAAPTFVSDRMLAAGKAKGLKALVLPGTKHVRADVAAEIDKYLRGGGTVVLLPDLPTEDEYCRPTKLLGKWGVTVEKSHVPQISGLGEFEQGYDQNLKRAIDFGPGLDVIADKVDRAFMGDGIGVATSGIFHEIAAKGAKVLASSDEYGPMLVSKKIGKGVLYVFAGMPTVGTLSDFLDVLYDSIGVERHLRTTNRSGKRVRGLEARLVRRRLDDLVYLVNSTPEPQEFVIETNRPHDTIRELRGLRYWDELAGVIPPQQAYIFSVGEDPVMMVRKKVAEKLLARSPKARRTAKKKPAKKTAKKK